MSEDTSNVIGVVTVYNALLRLEGKVDAMGSRFSDELDEHRTTNTAALDTIRNEQIYLKGKIDGSLGMVKWLGPTGVAALLVALAKASGVL